MWESTSPTAPSMKTLYQEPSTSPVYICFGINYSREKGKIVKKALMHCITFQMSS